MIRLFLEGNYPDIDFHFIENADFKTTNNIYSLWLTKPMSPDASLCCSTATSSSTAA